MFKTIKQKVIFTLLTFFILGFGILFVYISINFKNISDESAKDQLQTLSQTVFQGINTGMKLGNPEEELQKLRAIEGIAGLNVYRSPHIIELFGKPEKAIKGEEITQVYKSGEQNLKEMYLEDGKHLFVLQKPLPATGECISCHANAKEGEILGVMELEIDFDKIDEAIATFELNLTIGMAAAALLAIIIFSIFFQKVVLKPIQYLTDHAKDLSAGEGDLTQRLHVLADDELGEASTYINYFIEKIEHTVNDTKKSSVKNIALTETLSSTTGTIEGRAKDGQKIVDEAASIGGALQQVLDSSVTVAEKTKTDIIHADRLLQESQQQIASMAEDIRQSADMEAELARNLQQLSGDAEQVKGVLTMISDIADQTNLLALNAAIEAARAGEHGRGFAVVADEVRKLAERTQKSLSEINAIINTIVQAITDSSDQMSENAEKINQVNETSMNVENSISETSQLMGDATQASEQSLHESISMSEQVKNFIEKIEMINEISKQNEISVEEIRKIATNINSTAQDLNKQLDHFKS